jgi:hypothetical protein
VASPAPSRPCDGKACSITPGSPPVSSGPAEGVDEDRAISPPERTNMYAGETATGRETVMKAIVQDKYGSSEVLELRDIASDASRAASRRVLTKWQ